MSTFETKNMSGALFRVEEKETDKHPDYTGKVKINNKEYRLAGWLSESKSGKKYLSLKVSEWREQEPKSRPSVNYNDDDIPF